MELLLLDAVFIAVDSVVLSLLDLDPAVELVLAVGAFLQIV